MGNNACFYRLACEVGERSRDLKTFPLISSIDYSCVSFIVFNCIRWGPIKMSSLQLLLSRRDGDTIPCQTQLYNKDESRWGHAYINTYSCFMYICFSFHHSLKTWLKLVHWVVLLVWVRSNTLTTQTSSPCWGLSHLSQIKASRPKSLNHGIQSCGEVDPALDGLTLSMRFVLHYTSNLNMSIWGNSAPQKVPLSISNKPWKATQNKTHKGGKLRLDLRDDLLFTSQSFHFALFPRQALTTAGTFFPISIKLTTFASCFFVSCILISTELWKNCGGDVSVM